MTAITLEQRKKYDIPHLRRMFSCSSNIEQTKPRGRYHNDAVSSSSSSAARSSSLQMRNGISKYREFSSEYYYLNQLWHFLFKIDTLMILTLIVYAFSYDDAFLSDMVVGCSDKFKKEWFIGFMSKPLQCRTFVELANLVIQGVIERTLILPFVTYLDEANFTSSIRFTPLPDTKAERNKQFQEASTMPAPFLHNKNAILMNLIVLLPLEIGTLLRNNGTGEVTMTSATSTLTFKQLCKSLLFGLVIIDLTLGTAHMISHRGALKRHLWPFHARHHTQHYNYASIKFCGEPFDLEVFLTQFCYAFLPRLLGMDVLTGIVLVNAFSIQLLVEHTGYRCFYLSYFHEAHHRYGSVAFYHFPVWEVLFGKMPSLSQFRNLCSNKSVLANVLKTI